MRDLRKLVVMVLSTTIVVAGVTVPEKANAQVLQTEDINWSFFQGGQYNKSEPDNEGYINSVTMNGSDEVLNGWIHSEEGCNQEQSATTESDGFTIDIENTGWERDWSENRIDPWSVQAIATSSMSPQYDYKVSFKAKASQSKLAYIDFSTVSNDSKMHPYEGFGLNGESDSQLIQIGTEEKTYTYYFNNLVDGKELKTIIMLGAFDSKNDFDGNDVSDIIQQEENCWKGTVTISDFTIEGHVWGPCPTTTEKNTEITSIPVIEQTTNTTTNQVTTEQESKIIVSKASIKSAKRNKSKKSIKVTIKKISHIKGYQIKYSLKSKMTPSVIKETKKNVFTIKKIKNRKYYIQVRAYKVLAGKRHFGNWSNKKTVK